MKKGVILLILILFLVACSNSQSEIERNKQYIYNEGQANNIPDNVVSEQSPPQEDLDLIFPDKNETLNETNESTKEIIPKDSVKKTFNILASQWKFKPNQVVVNVGDEVTFLITSLDINDLFEIPDFGISVDLEPQSQRTVSFIPNETGKFKFWCKGDCTNVSQMEGLIYVK